MIRIAPPQSGQGSRNVNGMISALGGSSGFAISAPSKVRIFASLTMQKLADQPLTAAPIMLG
jgi:hypothetical protein